MLKFILRNNFHNTRKNVRPKRDLKGRYYIEGWTLLDCRRKLCGVKDCDCSDEAGTRPSLKEEYDPATKRYYFNNLVERIDGK